MTKYSIINRVSGADLGTYEAESREAALDAMARDAGYRDHAHACEVTGEDGSDLAVTEIERRVTLTETETADWESDESLRRTVRSRAQEMADRLGRHVEIYSHDGVTLDALDPQGEA